MAFLISPGRWRVKPGPDVELDPRHPLVDGLVGCWLMNEAAGGAVVDHAGNTDGVIVGASITRLPRLPGRVLDFAGDNNGDRVDLGTIASGNPLMLDGDQATWMWDARLTSYVNNAPRLIDKSTSGTGANGWALYPINSPSITWTLAVAATEYRLGSGHLLGTRSRGALVKDGTSRVALYDADQNRRYVEITSGINPIPTATANGAIGNWNHATDRNWRDWISHIYVWNRVLSAHEIVYLQSKPYAIFRPRVRRKLYLPSAFAEPPQSSGAGVIVCIMG